MNNKAEEIKQYLIEMGCGEQNSEEEVQAYLKNNDIERVHAYIFGFENPTTKENIK